jgi:hydroxyacylglutathione hydrolase
METYGSETMDIEILTFGDNYIYLCRATDGGAFVVDPGQAAVVLQALKARGGRLTHILLTHHHGDHTGGTARLRELTGCHVVGADRVEMPLIDTIVSDKEEHVIGGLRVRTIATPGHTRDSVCYFLPAQSGNPTPILFTGDTLFVGGCGRVFECDAGTMWRSLNLLAELPEDTRVYCGHEYTADNYRFAAKFFPRDAEYARRLTEAQATAPAGRPTVPSTIASEKRSNVFLRAGSVESFAHLRGLKDRF